MSKITAIGFALLDAVLSLATIVQSSLTLAVVLMTVITSLGLALMSKTIRSIICPTYFWDEP